MKARMCCLFLAIVVSGAAPGVASAQVGWMQPGVRLWYLGAVGSAGAWGQASSNAEESYLFEAIVGNDARVVHHSALTHWTAPRPIETSTHPVLDMGPVWIHPQRLQTLRLGDRWMGYEITFIENTTYDHLAYKFLPANALTAINPARQIVKLTYMIAFFSVGNAYFDRDTGILLYYHSLWGNHKMFFALAEINYDFAQQAVTGEDAGPHTGYRSFVSESSMGSALGVGGGSVVIHSMVESRYGAAVEMRVLSTATGPYGMKMGDENYCFFGDVPIVRRMDATEAPNFPPEQWNPYGQYLWWWLPPPAMHAAPLVPARHSMAAVQAINVLDVPMTKTADQPLTYTATQSPSRFHFTRLWFGSDGFITAFEAKDPTTGLDIRPSDNVFMNPTQTDGAAYYQASMARPAPFVTSIFPAAGPTTGGVAMTITGTNFVAGATGVSIGGAAATNVTVQGTTSLTCTMPAGSVGKRDVVVTVAGVSTTVPGAFEYFAGAVISPPADPAQAVVASVPVQGGTVTATFTGVTAAGTLTVVPTTGPTSPVSQITLLPGATFFLSAPGVAFSSATMCFPYREADVTAAGAVEDALMVWYQPAGSTAWVDVTASHDMSGDRICAVLNGLSLVSIAAASATPLAHVRYLAEGATSGFLSTTIALANPSVSGDASALLRFQRADATTRVRFVSVPPHGRRTLDVRSVPEMATAEFSTVIESDQPLVTDRTMSWDARGYGSHAETSIPAPATTWYLAEGATHSGLNLFYLLQNPNMTKAQVRVRYLRPSGAPLEKDYTLPPTSRTNIWVNEEDFAGLGKALVGTDVSAVFDVTNGQPIIVERALYLDLPGQTFGAGHESAGVTAPATQWFLAEGATGPYFDLFVLVANPATLRRQHRGHVPAADRRDRRQELHGGPPTAASTSGSTTRTCCSPTPPCRR